MARYCSYPARPGHSARRAGCRSRYYTSFLRTREIVPLGRGETQVEVACWDPLDDSCPRRWSLPWVAGYPVLSEPGRRSLLRWRGSIGVDLRATASAGPSDALAEDEEVDRLKDLASDAPIIRLVHVLSIRR